MGTHDQVINVCEEIFRSPAYNSSLHLEYTLLQIPYHTRILGTLTHYTDKCSYCLDVPQTSNIVFIQRDLIDLLLEVRRKFLHYSHRPIAFKNPYEHYTSATPEYFMTMDNYQSTPENYHLLSNLVTPFTASSPTSRSTTHSASLPATWSPAANDPMTSSSTVTTESS